MPTMISAGVMFAPWTTPQRQLTVRLTRDGEQTSEQKIALLMTPDMQLQAVMGTPYEQAQSFAAAEVDGTWLLLALDLTAPRRAAARYPTITADSVFAIDLNDGSGGGASGQTATLAARVRVEGVDADRELVAMEQQADGAWRVAGNLKTADGELDLRVIGQSVYVMALDDYGVSFQPQLEVTVGQRIRPSLYAGWLYQITEPGTLPEAEPTWWPAEGDNAARLIGTARAIAVRYYRPLAHGPIPVELT